MKIKSLLAVGAVNVLLAAMPMVAMAQGGLRTVPAFQGTSNAPLLDAIVRIVNWFLVLAALVAAVMIVYGGVKYIISLGDEEAATEAKNIILYAVIGLIVIGLAAALVNFVIGGIAASG